MGFGMKHMVRTNATNHHVRLPSLTTPLYTAGVTVPMSDGGQLTVDAQFATPKLNPDSVEQIEASQAISGKETFHLSFDRSTGANRMAQGCRSAPRRSIR